MNPTSAPSMPPLPEAFIESLTLLPGIDREALVASLDTPSAVSVRLNPAKPMTEDILAPLYAGQGDESRENAARVPWCADGRYLSERPLFTLMPEMHGGAFYVQDASSMIHSAMTERIAEAEQGRPLRVLDVCAAPGGKTTAMLSVLPEGSVMAANEYSPQRVKALEENIIKYGTPNVLVTCGDGSLWGGMEEYFDVVAVDAPCSGEGMMRKEEVARTQWSPGLVESCARTQRDILAGAVKALHPGGWLIYSTCTFNLTEDEHMVRHLVEEYGLIPALPSPDHFSTDPANAPIAGFDPEISSLRFMPHVTRGEGLFVTVLRKPTDGTAPLPYSDVAKAKAKRAKDRKDKGSGKGKGAAATPDLTECRRWIKPGDDMVWIEENDRVTAMPATVADIMSRLPRGIRPVRAGVEVARVKGRDLIPSPELALSTWLDRGAFPEVEVSREDALKYLRSEAITLPPDIPRGMALISHNGVALGWMKNIGNRANNHWPTPWRIRMQ